MREDFGGREKLLFFECSLFDVKVAFSLNGEFFYHKEKPTLQGERAR